MRRKWSRIWKTSTREVAMTVDRPGFVDLDLYYLAGFVTVRLHSLPPWAVSPIGRHGMPYVGHPICRYWPTALLDQ